MAADRRGDHREQLDQGVFRTMLASMPGGDGGPSDKLLAVTRRLTGAFSVIPSADRLAALDGEAGAHG